MLDTSLDLTPRQQRFVEAYVLDRNAARAARSAGYSANGAKVTACRLLTKANLQAALAAKEAELAARLQIDRAAVVGGIFEAIGTARLQGDAAQAIRGWVEVAKLTGLDKPEAENRVLSAESAVLRAKFEALSDEDLLAIAEGRT